MFAPGSRSRAKRTNAIHFLRDGETLTVSRRYDEIEEAMRAQAGHLRHACGVRSGDRVLLVTRDPLHFATAFLACQFIGAVPVGLSPNLNRHSVGPRLIKIARDTCAVLLLTDAAQGGHAAVAELRAATGIAVRTIDACDATGYPPAERIDSEIAFIQYTSGSTHEPKGSVVSRAALVAQLDFLTRSFGFDERSIFVSWLPLHHDMGLVSKLLLPYHLGATSVHMLPAAFIQRPVRWLRAIERFGGTVSSAPNFAYELCLRIPEPELDAIDLSSWSSAVCGAEPVRASTLEAFAARFAPHGFDARALCAAYGMAETTLLVTMRRGVTHDAPRTRHVELDALGTLASCGALVEQGMTVKIVDPTTRMECDPGEIGDIWVSGPSLANGYARAGEEDRAAFRHTLATDDGAYYFATGDLGYTGPSGLHVLGRVGSAMAVGGRKVFFSDIEYAMSQVDTRFAPNSTAAFATQGEHRVTLVVEGHSAAFAADAAPLAIRCATAIETAFPVAVSGVLYATRPLPRTSSGKLQRDRARVLFETGRLPGKFVPFDGGAQHLDGETRRSGALAAIARALEIPVAKVRLEGTLAQHGAESLAIVRIQFELERRYGCKLDRAALYTSIRVRDLLDIVSASQPAMHGGTYAGASSLERHACATHYQRALHFSESLAGCGVYTLHRAVRVEGKLDLDILRAALRALESRYDALRGTLRPAPNGLRYWVDPAVTPSLVVDDRRDNPTTDDEALQEWGERSIPADGGRRYRLVVLRCADDRAILLLQIHHAIADFWSLVIVWRDLWDLYEALACGEPVPQAPACAAYADYCADHVRYLESSRASEDAAFWRSTLSPAFDARLPLPPLHVDRYEATRVRCVLPGELLDALRATAARGGTTVNCGIQLALQMSLAALTRRTRVRYGLALLNRTANYRETVGMFANLVPIESALNLQERIDSALAGVRSAMTAALAHEACPLSLLGQDAASTGTTPGTLFDVTYAYFDMTGAAEGDAADVAGQWEAGRTQRAGLDLAPCAIAPAHIHYPLQLQLFASAHRLDLIIDYRTHLLEPLLLSSWLAQFRFALSVVASHTHRCVGDAVVMTPELTERLREWGRSAGGAYGSTLARFVRTAESAPQASALVPAAGGDHWTYEKLFAVAGEFARRVARVDAPTGARVVAMMLPRGPLGVAACIGIMLAGGTYMPIDPKVAAARRDYMLHDSGACAVIASRHTPLDGIALPVIDADACGRCTEPCNAGDWITPSPDHPAYLIYTSGSTGKPKGVLVSHRALDSRIDWMIEHLALDRDDVFVHKTIWTFDVSLWEIFAPLAIGAKAICIDAGQERFPEQMAAAMVAHGVTIAHFVPSVMMHWLEIAAVRPALRALRIAVCSGERMLLGQVRGFFERAPETRLFNFYGPTEAGIDVTYAELDPRTPTVTIGRAAPRCEVAIVDELGTPVVPGAVGELVVGGPQTAIGYVHQPAMTAAHFVPSPLGTGARCYRTGDIARFDETGAIVYLGRRDGQVKFSGYRLELGEIEHALASMPGVRDVVVMLDGEDAAQRLCAFLSTGGDDGGPTRDAALSHARRWLPEFMVPHRWQIVPDFPRLANGKLDHAGLRAMLERDEAAGKLEGPAEQGMSMRLAEHWQAVLGGRLPTDDDDFFEAGGDSILALQYIGRLRQDGIALSVQTLFRQKRFGTLRASLARSDFAPPSAVPLEPFALAPTLDCAAMQALGIQDAYPLSYLQRGIVYHYFNDDHYEAFVTSLELVAPWNASAMRRALDYVAAEHAFLRTSIDLERYADPLQLVHETVEIPLAVHDLTEMHEGSLRVYLQAWIEREKVCPFAWDSPPHCRCTVHLLDAQRFQLTLSDASLDGWCVATVLTELLRAYSVVLSGGAPAASPAPTCSYAEFVALEQTSLMSGAPREFWSRTLAQRRPTPARRMTRIESAPHSRLTLHADEALVGRIERVARAAGVPLKHALMAVHFAALVEVSAEAVQTSGVEFNGRPESAGGDRCVGVFNNMLPLVLDLSTLDWRQAMRSCFEAECDCLPYRRFPYAELVKMNGGQPVFDTLFVYTHFHVYRMLESLPIRVASHYASDQTYVPLTVHFNRSHRAEGLEVMFDYDARVIRIEHVEQLHSAVGRMLAELGFPHDGEAALARPAARTPATAPLTF
ncbi:amino acid adenylation domain-containing protein [Paraburkholderia caledonica]|uniref:Amino acid adenylation domain-containing protein n=1 Tax=Paraburkholderia caledonica TaxID=134536 RepID=A0AB73IHZ3_9BURK|nr:amino acid adenylation domain-containing protein [Paraburkholderia caledonica]